MKKHSPFIITVILSIGLLFSCAQSDIFYQIESEIKLKDPKIDGGPSRIVECQGHIYVASGSLYEYYDGSWEKHDNQPPGIKILELAVTNRYLYVLTSESSKLRDNSVYRYDPNRSSSDWEEIGNTASYPDFQSIYGSGDTVFAGVSSGSSYSIAYAAENMNSFESLSNSGGIISGAGFYGSRYFISIADAGVFASDSVDTLLSNPVAGTGGGETFTAFLSYDDPINSGTPTMIMVSMGGTLCKVTDDGAGLKIITEYYGHMRFSGALSFWTNPDSAAESSENFRLLLGRRGSDIDYNSYGYWEMPLPAGDGYFYALEEPNVTVENNASYATSLGRHYVTSIYQVPQESSGDGSRDRPIFASTQQNALWSCRQKVWNLED
jgi:hypothetical protein